MDRLVPVTKDSGYFPPIGRLMPNNQKLGLAETFFGFNIAEHVMSLFDGAIPLDRENLHASRRKYAPEITAYVLARFIDVILPRPRDATFVVIKLDVWIQITCVLFKLIGRAAVIECIEECGIHF